MAVSKIKAFTSTLRTLGLLTPEDVEDAARAAGRAPIGDSAGLMKDPFLWFGRLSKEDQEWVFHTLLEQPEQRLPERVQVFMGFDRALGPDMTVTAVFIHTEEGTIVECVPRA